MMKFPALLVVLLLINGRLGHCDDHEENKILNHWENAVEALEAMDEAVEESPEESSEEAPSNEDPLKALENSMLELLELSSNETEKIKADILSQIPKPPKGMKLVPANAQRMMVAGPRKMSSGNKKPTGRSAQQKIRFWANKCTKQNPFCDMSAQECLELFPGMEAYISMDARAKRFLDCCRCHINYQCNFPTDIGNNQRLFA